MVDSQEKNSEKFSLECELSALVENNVISKRIADRLQKKLIEKQVKISKEQLYIIVKKISEIIKAYRKNDQVKKGEDTVIKAVQTADKKLDTDMQKLISTIGKLQDKIASIESGVYDDKNLKISTQTPKIVKTDDIKIPKEFTKNQMEFKFEPLSDIPTDPESIIVLMRWLQHLIDKCGHFNLSAILDYYVDIGWITQDAKLILIDYSNGITEDRNKLDSIKKEICDLPSQDHIQSLYFIQKLKGKEIDKHFIDRIDGELTRTTKKLENYQSK